MQYIARVPRPLSTVPAEADGKPLNFHILYLFDLKGGLKYSSRLPKTPRYTATSGNAERWMSGLSRTPGQHDRKVLLRRRLTGKTS